MDLNSTKMDYKRSAMLVLGVVISIVSLVSGQADMAVTYSSVNWFPVGEQSTLICQVEHTENRDALSVYWSRQKEGEQTYEKIGAYDSRDNSTYKYASAPADISDRFILPDGDAYDDSTLTATSYIIDTNLNDAGRYQCEVEDTKAHMAKAAAFVIQVYSLPSSVTVEDGQTSLSMLPAQEEGSAEEPATEEPEVEPIASCIVEGVYPLPSQIDFTNDNEEILQSITELTATEGEDGLYTVTADLFLDASRSLHGHTIGCTVKMAEGINIEEMASTRSSAVEVLYPTETLTLTISPEVAEEGETVTISCSGDGNPAPEVYITGPNGVETRSSLQATYADDGTYTCSTDELTVEETLEVYYIRTPTIDGADKKVVKTGESVYTVCSAVGNPAPSVEWLSPTNEIVSYNGVLDLSMVDRNSAGLYTCVADNQAGRYTVDFDVSVQYGCTAEFKKLVSYSKMGGGKAYVKLTCVATGDPTCEVTITGNGCTGSASLGESTCEIQAMEPQSTAPKYMCTATNGIGSPDEQGLTLDDDPVFIGAKQDATAIETAGMPAGGIAAIIIIIVLVVIGVPAACYYCRRQRTPSTKNAKAMEAGEEEKLADAENQE